MSTINHIRVAQSNSLIARECAADHRHRDREFPAWLRQPKPPDPYERRSNVCPECHVTKALGTGECFC